MSTEEITKCKVWKAKIFVALREGYSGKTHTVAECKKVVQEFVKEISWCVTVTPTEYIYRDDSEPGVIIGTINYPRFQLKTEELKERTLNLARLLKKTMGQQRVSVMFPDETVMIGAVK